MQNHIAPTHSNACFLLNHCAPTKTFFAQKISCKSEETVERQKLAIMWKQFAEKISKWQRTFRFETSSQFFSEKYVWNFDHKLVTWLFHEYFSHFVLEETNFKRRMFVTHMWHSVTRLWHIVTFSKQIKRP